MVADVTKIESDRFWLLRLLPMSFFSFFWVKFEWDCWIRSIDPTDRWECMSFVYYNMRTKCISFTCSTCFWYWRIVVRWNSNEMNNNKTHSDSSRNWLPENVNAFLRLIVIWLVGPKGNPCRMMAWLSRFHSVSFHYSLFNSNRVAMMSAKVRKIVIANAV